MVGSDYFVAFIAMIVYYIIGLLVTKKISPLVNKYIFLKYYNISFFISVLSILLVHIAFVLDGNVDGMPKYYDSGNDSLRYILAAKLMINEGITTKSLISLKVTGAYTYVFLVYIQFVMFGTNILVVIFFNALLYSLTTVLIGNFAANIFSLKYVKWSMLFFILYFCFLSHALIPLKETLILFLTIIVLITTYNLNEKFKSRSFIIFSVTILLLFFTRAYIAAILLASSFFVIFTRFTIRNILASILVFFGAGFFLLKVNILGGGLASLYENAYFNIGTWKAEGNQTGFGVENAMDVIISGKIDYLRMVYVQITNAFFRPFFTSYPRLDAVYSSGTYIRTIYWYAGSFIWYFLLPSIFYGFIHMIKNRKDLIILYLPAILLFLFFIFTRNQLRYQMVTRMFWILIGVYGLQFYSQWKKYVIYWLILYIAIAFVTA